MKKYLPFLILPLILIMLILLIIKSDVKQIDKILTVNTNNNYLYSDNQTIDLSFYTNDNTLPLNKIDAYDNFYLSDLKETKVLSLNLEDVYYSHTENYLKENYLNYVLKFEMPNLEHDFYIEEAYLNFSLANNKKYQLKVGNFNLIYLDNLVELNWKSLDSKKKDSNDHSISKVIIELNNKLSNDLLVSIGNENNLDYLYKDDVLTILIENDDLFTNNIPIIIKDNNSTYFINNTYYIKEFALLTKAGALVNTYEFN